MYRADGVAVGAEGWDTVLSVRLNVLGKERLKGIFHSLGLHSEVTKLCEGCGGLGLEIEHRLETGDSTE